jgi:hypothetical protein
LSSAALVDFAARRFAALTRFVAARLARSFVDRLYVALGAFGSRFGLPRFFGASDGWSSTVYLSTSRFFHQSESSDIVSVFVGGVVYTYQIHPLTEGK